MSTATAAGPIKRAVPVPPAKPKVGGASPKAGTGATAGQAVPNAGNTGQTMPGSPGTGAAGVGPTSAALLHRRVASASPSIGNTSQPPLAAVGPPASPAEAPPKVGPKPPGRPKSGALSPAMVRAGAPPASIPPHLLLAPAELQSLATSYSVSKSEVDALQMLFLEMDTDNDGVISMADLLRYKYASRKTPSEPAEESTPQEEKEEAPSSTLPITFQASNANGIVQSSSAPRLLKLTSEEDDSDSDDSMSEAKKMLEDMELTESSEDAPPPSVNTTPNLTDVKTASPKQGLSFRHIDFSTLPKTEDDSGDDDHLLADWDGPPEDETKSTGSKSSKSKPTSSGSSFGGLKKKFSKGALNLKSKLNAAGK